MKWSRKHALIALLVPALALTLMGCSKAPTDDKDVAATAAGEAAGEVATEKTALLAIGSKGSVGPYALTVSKAERASEIADPDGKSEPQIAASGKEFLVLTLELANDTDKPSGTGPAYFKLTDSAGAEFEEFQTNGMDFIFNMPEPVPAKGTATTKIAYEVTKGSTGFTLVWEPFVEGAAASSISWQVD